MSKDLNMSYLLDFYGEVLTEKQKEIMQQYFNMDLSLSEVADNFNISRQGVRDSIKRSESTLLDLEKKIGFAEKYKKMIEGIEEIQEISQSIIEYNNNLTSPISEIDRYSINIAEITKQILE